MENANQLVISKLGGREGADGAGRAALTERDPPPHTQVWGRGHRGRETCFSSHWEGRRGREPTWLKR